ncbi:MAG: hypothetical protein R3F02_02730 [Thiolinea sp.]
MYRLFIATTLLITMAATATAEQGLIEQVKGNEKNIVINQKLLKATLNPWEKNGQHLIDLLNFEKTGANGKKAMGCSSDVDKYEYMLWRNGAYRKITFSEWNGGCRAMTEFYWRGDVYDTPPYGDVDSAASFMLGGSFWTYNTKDPNDDKCKGKEVYHFYYGHAEGRSYIPINANGCSVEAELYRRKIWFAEDIEHLING